MAQAQPQGQLKNLYHRRLVAPTSSKPCFICHKATSTVLITPDDRDFFYACAGHLSDRGFATPQDGGAAPVNEKKVAEEKKRKEELDKEIEKVKKEWEEKQKKRKKKDKEKDRDKDKDEGKEEKEEEKAHDEKVKKLEEEKKDAEKNGLTDTKKNAEEARVFALHRSIFQMRLNRIQAAVQAKKDRERARNPISFPQVPSGPVT